MKKLKDPQSKINWMKYKVLYFGLSATLILIGVVSIVKWQFVLGIDFAGGTNVLYKFEKQVSVDEIKSSLKNKNIETVNVIQNSDNIFELKLGQVDEPLKGVINETFTSVGGQGSALLRFEQVGPSLSQELLRKTLYAIFLAEGVILVWIAYQFKSLKFGICATIATFHDAFIVIGLFSLFGHFFNAEVDYLFVTALLTILSFSVHDTIVVYDRIREIRKKHGGGVVEIANRALSETMRRSVLNSLTILIMLVSLVVFGGNTIRWFAVALTVGTILGTYSSPFVAVPLLVIWEEMEKRLRK